MDTRPITPARLAQSVIAVPPLARDREGVVDRAQNQRLIRHIESGGVDILLYGGNANFYHLRPSEYETTLAVLADEAGAGTLVVPAVGPAFGLAMDQARIARRFAFPTVMMLPHTGILTFEGVEEGFRRFVDAYGKPAVLYIKQEGYIAPEGAARLVADGLVSWIKYAIVRPHPGEDPFLQQLVGMVDPQLIVSGIGEQPAIEHLRDFRCNGFTSGCVCVAPALSTRMLKAIQAGDWTQAENIKKIFQPLEDLRNAINPIRVLHEAVALAGISETGEVLPLLSPLAAEERERVSLAAQTLRAVG